MQTTYASWMHHPFVLFAVPLVVLLCFPWLYSLIVSPESAWSLHNENQLQEIASLMDDIYTTMANMTFIPETSIKRGPHQIDKTAIPCERNHAAMRLLEILPYVDVIDLDPKEAEASDWLFGGRFIDYRNPEHLEQGCDPLHDHGTDFRPPPATVALTSYGSGGWNSDRTWVLLYDCTSNAMRIYDGEDFIGITDLDDRDSHSTDVSEVGIFNHSLLDPLSPISKNNLDWKEWFTAPTVLKRILAAYQTLALTPWETSNNENKWDVNMTIIKELLQRNGWPMNFDPDQFNADFIRAKYRSSGRGHAEVAFKALESLVGHTQDDFIAPDGTIEWSKYHILQHEEKAAEADDEDNRLYWTFRAQQAKWDLEEHEAELEAARKEVDRLCPDEICIEEDESILWDFRNVEEAYEKSQRALPPDNRCREDLYDFVGYIPQDTSRFNNCVAQRQREARWLQLAYEQAKTEALQYCTSTRRTLLPQPTLEERINFKIKEHQDEIERLRRREIIMSEWEHNLGEPNWENPGKARLEFNIRHDLVSQGAFYLQDYIERLQIQLAEDEARVVLARCMDDEECASGL